MELLSYFFLLGFGASFIGSLVGLGGGFIIVPVIYLLFGIPIKNAIFISLIGTMTLSLVHNLKNKELIKSQKEVVSKLALFSVLGSVGASILGSMTPPHTVAISFACVLIFFSLLNLRNKPLISPDISFKHRERSARILFFLSGSLAGFFGLGGGSLNVPILEQVLHYKIREAAKLSFFFIFIAAGAAILTQLKTRSTEIHEIPILYPAFLVLGMLGGYLLSQKIKMKDHHLKKVFSLILFCIGCWKLYYEIVVKTH